MMDSRPVGALEQGSTGRIKLGVHTYLVLTFAR